MASTCTCHNSIVALCRAPGFCCSGLNPLVPHPPPPPPSFFYTNVQDWTVVGPAGLSSNLALHVSLAFAPNTSQPYVAFTDWANSSRTTVKRLDGNAWVAVGSLGFSAITSWFNSLAFQPNSSVPYVAYSEMGSSHMLNVRRFTGNAWVSVGPAGFSVGRAEFDGLAFQPNSSVPFVAYLDTNSGKATVVRFNGSAWSPVGLAQFTVGVTAWTSLAFQPNSSVPYLAFRDGSILADPNHPDMGKATVVAFDGSTWRAVGSPGFSAGSASYTSLAFQPNTSQPFVAFQDGATTGAKATVMRYDGFSWSAVGSPGFSATGVTLTTLAFEPTTSQPYVAYLIGCCSNLGTVMRYSGNAWVSVGSPNFVATSTIRISLVFQPNSALAYVAYQGLLNGTVMVYPVPASPRPPLPPRPPPPLPSPPPR